MKTIDIPIYGGRLIVANSQSEFDRVYKRILAGQGVKPCEESVALCRGGMTSSEVIGNEVVIVSGVFDRRGSTLCHEAVHCAQVVAEAAGMDPIREQEAFAYLTQWFYEGLAP